MTAEKVKEVLKKMDTTPLILDCMINSSFYQEAFVDSGCLCFSAFSERLVRYRRLPRISLPEPKQLKLAKEDEVKREITHLTVADVDIDGRKQQVWGYVIKDLAYDLILGKPWMEHNDIVYMAQKRAIRFGSKKKGLVVREKGWYEGRAPKVILDRVAHVQAATMVVGGVFTSLAKRARKIKGAGVYAITIREIDKALEEKPKLTAKQIEDLLPHEIKGYAKLFEDDSGPSSLAPPRKGIDMRIDLKKDAQGRELEVPFGPLYGMSRDELLVLRKTLTGLLDKNWIRASSSPGGAPVLFVKKPGGGLRFCVDYRALNTISERDRYPLPLIKETLRTIAKAQWVTKVDVRAAFHRLRIREGDEWKTAFRTRFGAYEYLVTPFGLAGAPAAFQRWINSVLGELLGDFCSAYMDDVLIYTDGTQEDHWNQVHQVLQRLEKAGLKLDLTKCEFAEKQTKYLGFIIKLGEGISMDPEKVEAIKAWEPPTSVKGVRSFIGFANFYRDFIEEFSELAEPLQRLTKKNVAFQWGKEQEAAFETLKDRFITAPVLAMWHEDRLTILEADCSGWAMGGCLSQYGLDGTLRPVAYLSKKLSPAECNYEIHDKELLAIIRCMEEWRGELIGLDRPFVVLSDHKNLEHFKTAKRLTERQVRWSYTLSQFDFRLKFRAGKYSERPDALSRREQDTPKDASDERLKERVFQLIKDDWIDDGADPQILSMGYFATTVMPVRASPTIPTGEALFAEPELQSLWDQGVKEDPSLQKACDAVHAGERRFKPELELKVQIAECDFDARGALRFRRRVWVPKWEPLQTALIQRTHDSHITGHPGRESTLAILSRSFFWPGASAMVRQFCKNCDICGRSKVWRERRKGLLLPLPIPDRFWQELSIDFMTELPARKKGDPRYMMVITDRLGKDPVLEPMSTMAAEQCAERFINCHYRFHGFPRSIVSDRGSNWVGDFWKHLCKLASIKQRLSTAFHPQTDGSTERMNQEVLAYLRAFITYAQFDWVDLCPSAQLGLSNRDTGVGHSPFFAKHGYNLEPIQPSEQGIRETLSKASDGTKRAEAFVDRLRLGQELAASSMAYAQQRMEQSANAHRAPAERFQIGDLVWLNLRNISTPQLKKKLAWVSAKYRVLKVVSPHVVRLNVPSGIWPSFHVDLLKRAATDPLPSQIVLDAQPPPLLPEDLEGQGEDEEWAVERILRAEERKRGRGLRRDVLVKWAGYEEPTWEPRAELEGTDALSDFETRYGTGDDVGEDQGARQGPKRKGRG